MWPFAEPFRPVISDNLLQVCILIYHRTLRKKLNTFGCIMLKALRKREAIKSHNENRLTSLHLTDISRWYNKHKFYYNLRSGCNPVHFHNSI